MMKVLLLAQGMPQQQVDPHSSLCPGALGGGRGFAIDGRSQQGWIQPSISDRVGKGRL